MRIRIYGKCGDSQQKHVQVILKNIPKNVARRLTFRNHDFFKNEIGFYEIALPALLKFQEGKKVSDPFDKYVKLFLTYADGTNDVICLEDASLQSYGSAIRQEGIDYIHCKNALKSLAQFHALSFAMKDQDPEEFNRIKHSVSETYYHESLRDWYSKFWNRISWIAIDAVEKEYPDSIYVDKIKKFAVPERYDDMIKATSGGATAVISHGDSWTNNFLFKYEDGKPVDAKIIDFQLSRCASPVLDVVFIFYACTTKDLRDKHYEELIQYYYEVLSKQIKELGSNPDEVYSWSLYKEEVKKYSYFGLAFSFESTPMIILDADDEIEMNIKVSLDFVVSFNTRVIDSKPIGVVDLHQPINVPTAGAKAFLMYYT
jgi:thiamine kinase-like enzyme